MEVSRLLPDTVQFPGFGFSFNVDSEAFVIFGLSIKWYGIMIALGMLLAMIYGYSRTREFGIDQNRVTDVVFAGVIGAVIGARLYYVAFHADEYKSFGEIIAIRDGGLAVYGGIIGALICGSIAAKIRKLRMLPVLDIASPGLFIGQCLGRWGNFFNQEAFGTNTSLPWGMTGGRIQSYLKAHQSELAAKGIEVDPFKTVHPCFLYESVWCLCGFLILHFFYKKRKYDGEMFCIYAAWYGLGRFFIEGLRTDSLYIGGVRVSQALALVSALTAVLILIIMRIKAKKAGFVLYRDTEESKAAILAEEEAEKAEKEHKKVKKGDVELTEDQRIIADDDNDND